MPPTVLAALPRPNLTVTAPVCTAHSFEGLRMWFARLVILCFACGPALAEQDRQVTLVCRYLYPTLAGGEWRDANIKVDYEARTVDGAAAAISDGEIAWTESASGGHVDWKLNRFTGRVLGRITFTDGSRFPLSLEGTCVRA